MVGQLGGWIDDTEHAFESLLIAKCFCEHKGHLCGGVTRRTVNGQDVYEVHQGRCNPLSCHKHRLIGGRELAQQPDAESWLIFWDGQTPGLRDWQTRGLQWVGPMPGRNYVRRSGRFG